MFLSEFQWRMIKSSCLLACEVSRLSAKMSTKETKPLLSNSQKKEERCGESNAYINITIIINSRLLLAITHIIRLMRSMIFFIYNLNVSPTLKVGEISLFWIHRCLWELLKISIVLFLSISSETFGLCWKLFRLSLTTVRPSVNFFMFLSRVH